MTDIKERLRDERNQSETRCRCMCLEAADEIERLEAENAALHANNERLKSAAIAANEEICQTLGAVLGYPWFKDSPEIFPNATEADGVCVGPDTAETLAQAAADRIKTLKASNERMEAALRSLRGYGCPACGGDCSSANPPVIGCPMQDIEQALSTSQPVETDEARKP